MKRTGIGSDVPYFPQEIIRNILKRLPVKSLIRFQCVCKDWKNLIKNPSFITDHLQQSSHQNPSLLSEFNTITLSEWRLHLVDCGLQVREFQRSPLINSSVGACIIGSCNGLLLVEINHYDKSPPSLSLWNPATRAVKHVPITRADSFYFYDCVTGFGFSPVINDYKIVRTYGQPFAVNRVEVFSLSRGSWKRIDIGNLERVKLHYETVTGHGAIFWSGLKLGKEEEGEDHVEVIVSFDIAKEVFTMISMLDLDYFACKRITVYENKIAILCNSCKDSGGTFDLWVLDEGTWIKRYTSKPFSCKLDSVTIWRNEIVCTPYPKDDDDEGERSVLYLMNITTNEVKRIVIPYCSSYHSLYDYVESLESVGNNYIGEC